MSLSLSYSTETAKKPFPWRHILLATLIPALLGVVCAVFIAPPMLFPDTAEGFSAWVNFVEGGTWNSRSIPDPDSLERSIEEPVTWWAPGQYIPLGVLHLVGFRLGTACIIISAAALIFFGFGLACLAREMGLPRSSLTWLTLTACCSHHLLVEFGHFNGGELAQITIWPWAAFIAWEFRQRTNILIFALPPVLILGAFSKHSFAIYALALLFFLWVERIRQSNNWHSPLKTVVNLWLASYPILIIGILFLLGRHMFIDTAHTPGDSGAVDRGIYESFGYAFLGPILGLSGIDKTMTYFAYHTWGVNWQEKWEQLGAILFPLSLIPFGIYTWLSLKKKPTDRLAGNSGLSVGFIFFLLLWRGGNISLDSRHYQPVVMLFLIAVASRLNSRRCLLYWGARVVLSWVILFGIGTTLQRHINMLSPTRELFPCIQENITTELPPSVQEAVSKFTAIKGTLVYANTSMVLCALRSSSDSTARLSAITLSWGNNIKRARHGRLPQIVFAFKDNELERERATVMRESFKDYAPEEWSCYDVDGWHIWRAGDAPSPLESQVES